MTWQPPPADDPGEPRAQLPDTAFAFEKGRREPLTDAAHVRNALARFSQVQGVSDEDRAEAFENIRAAAAYYGVRISEKNWHDLMKSRGR